MQTRGNRELAEWTSDLPWDDEVDVICAGSGPGVLAHAIFCADADADVLLADAADPAEVSDAETRAYLAAMTEDLGTIAAAAEGLELSLIRTEPVSTDEDRRAKIAPFVGSRLRDFAARCVASPFGVLFTEVPEVGRTAMRTEAGERIQTAPIGPFRAGADQPGPALLRWLNDQARERGISRDAGTTVQRLIFDNGRVVGAAVATPSGTRLVRATGGVALSTVRARDAPDWPAQPDLRDIDTDVAIVAYTAGRFGRVSLLTTRSAEVLG